MNADLANFEAAAIQKDGGALRADLSSSAPEKPKEICTAAANNERRRSKRQRVVINVARLTAIKFEPTHHPEQESEGSRKRLRSGSVRDEKVVRDRIPASESVSALPEPMPTSSNQKKVKKHPEQHTDGRKGRVQIPNQKIGTSQQQQREIQNDWKKLYQDLHGRGDEIEYWKSRIEKESDSRDFFEYCMDALSRQNMDLYQQQEYQTKECNRWRESFHELDQKYTILTGEKRALKTEFDDCKESYRRAISENKALHGRVKQQELSVTKAQNAAMSVLSHSLSAMLPDNRIRSRFDELFESIAEWARDNAAAANQALLANSDNILKWQKDGLLRRMATEDSEPDLNFNLQDDTAVDTLLNTTMVKKICRDFLGNPFWFVGFTDSVAGASLPHGERLSRVRALVKTLKDMMESKFCFRRSRIAILNRSN